MRFFGNISRNTQEETLSQAVGPPIAAPDGEKQLASPVLESLSDSEAERPSEDLQPGVKKVEAVTLTWTKKELWLAYAFVFLVFFVISLQQQTQFGVAYYVTSSFALLPLTGTTSILSGVIGGVVKLPTAKFVDLVGRAEGFALMTFFATIGLIMMAACKNVETYAAAQVFYWVGFNGMAYVLDVFMADTSSLKNRALVFGFSTTPYIVTTFAGPRAAESFLKTSGWRWAYGTFTIVTPVIALPIMCLLWFNQRKAAERGLLIKEKSPRTPIQSISFYFWEFDVLGMLLIIGGFALLLLPFSLATYQRNTWRSTTIVCMFIFGGIMLLLFIIHEKHLAKKSFIPFSLLTDRSIIGACLLAMFLFMSFYSWDSYFYNYLQAVHGLSVTNTGYVYNIYSIGSCFWAIPVALLIRWTGRFKWLALAMLCLEILGVGLMVKFRDPSWGIGYVVMCQIFIAFGGGALVICEEMAVMAAAPHQNVAAMLALIGLFSSVGGAIGQAVSAAIYTNTFPGALDAALPGNATLNAELYGSLPSQLLYPIGSPERTAVIHAYAVSQRYLTITGVVFLIPCFLFIAVWQDFKVHDLRQVKGRVA
ncbi:siderophore iron transporter-like protein [Calycina marina]|uniref:Siderophore iron transporter-like protein n=1 Tax=Calycina marina TaxID=1763456 RepID=A0A9P8CE12_9HELO|nr:siderophore iron transporter-like protein [Calycina marina]